MFTARRIAFVAYRTHFARPSTAARQCRSASTLLATRCLPASSLSVDSVGPVRWAHQRTSGVKGLKARRFKATADEADDDPLDDDCETPVASDELRIEDGQYDSIAGTAMHVTRQHSGEQHVYVIQPYVKWGPRKSDVEPDLKLQESEALVRSLPGWQIVRSLKVPLDSLDKKHLFGTGKLQEIRMNINELRGAGSAVSCLFVSKGTLSGVQKRFLEKFFGVPVMDRYSMVIQILRLHATSTEAKLQVAAAEIPYIWAQMRDGSSDVPGSPKALHTLTDTQKEMLRTRERKLRAELKNVRAHREVLRNRRQKLNFPIVAVVGYTNAGKTSLIKALTADAEMQPRDQLFATLDVTAHAGHLPSKLKVIYMDTVGFMSDIPTGLIECFVATLEDAMLADIVVHVHDVSHPNHAEQSAHVEQTLAELLASVRTTRKDARYNPLDSIIHVGNKADLLPDGANALSDGDAEPFGPDVMLISSKTGQGIPELRERIEVQMLRATKRSRVTIRVPMGGQESSWLYKNAAVTSTAADPVNAQNLMLNVVISDTKLQIFRHRFVTGMAGHK